MIYLVIVSVSSGGYGDDRLDVEASADTLEALRLVAPAQLELHPQGTSARLDALTLRLHEAQARVHDLELGMDALANIAQRERLREA